MPDSSQGQSKDKGKLRSKKQIFCEEAIFCEIRSKSLNRMGTRNLTINYKHCLRIKINILQKA